MNSTKIQLLTLIITCSTILFAGCKEPEIDSRWRDREISIDGNDSEWGNYIQYYDEDTRVILCMFNDDQNMYIKVSSPNRMMQSQFISMGFTVWFDPNSGNDKKFGVHFPLGKQGGGLQITRGGEKPTQNDDQEKIQKMLEEIQKDIELIGPGKNKRLIMTVTEADDLGINVKMGKPKGNLIYELKIPLALSENHPYAVGIVPDKKIGVGFETGKINKNEMKKRMSDRQGQMSGKPGGMGERGGRPGGMGGRGGNRMPGGGMIPEPLELWAKVTLALAPITQ